MFFFSFSFAIAVPLLFSSLLLFFFVFVYSPHNLAILLNINFVLFSTYCFAVAVVSFLLFLLVISYLVFLLFLSLSARSFSPYLFCNINVVVISCHLFFSRSLSLSLPRLLVATAYKFIYFS